MNFNYCLTAVQNKELLDLLKKVVADPYVNVNNFKSAISELKVPHWFLEICEDWKNKDKIYHPEFLIKNVPIDERIPLLDFKNPVMAKYRLKNTSITEGFLELFAQKCNQTTIGYKNVNTGDIYQDIHPLERLKESQSQKSIVNLGFHKDLANHFVKPDFVNIICLRNDIANDVRTTFVRNIDLLNFLDSKTVDLLKESMYYTPYDALTIDGDKKNELGNANNHSILIDVNNVAFFEGRTRGLTELHQEVVNKVVNALHLLKRSIHFQPGDFISSENNTCLHGKEIIKVDKPEKLKERWLMKTVNVNNIEDHKQFILENTEYIING